MHGGKIMSTPLNSQFVMPEHVQQAYLEARKAVSASPRGAAALLRLAASVFAASDPLLGMGEKSCKIDIAIKAMVAKELPATVQKALDALRVIGNDSLCPWSISLREEPETATALFTLLKITVQEEMPQPPRSDAICVKLPPPKQGAIKKP